MKKITLILNMMVLFLLATSSVFADQHADLIKNAIPNFMQNNHVPGAAVILINNGQVSSYYFGLANTEKNIPVTQETIFELGSITKLMTALLLTQQIDSAKMNLTAPIKQYLPTVSDAMNKVTIKELATHTSSLPFDAPENIKNQRELFHYLATWTTKQTQGTEWIYSNFGIGLLSLSLEANTHKNFNQLYRSRILSPLNMQAIGITVPARLNRYYAQGYNENNEAVKPIALGLFPAAYAMKASAKDLQSFLAAAIGLPGTPERIFYPMRMTQAQYVQLSADKMQGLVWNIHPLTAENIALLLNEQTLTLGPLPVLATFDKPKFDGDALFDKTGSTAGFSAYIAAIPNKKSGIVILMNKHFANPLLLHLGREILFKMNNISPPPANNQSSDKK